MLNRRIDSMATMDGTNVERHKSPLRASSLVPALVLSFVFSTGCASLSAFGGSYPDDEVDRFHTKVERLHEDLDNTSAGFGRIRDRLRDVADGHRGDIGQVQKDIQNLRDLVKALQGLPRRAASMLQSGRTMIGNAQRHYVGKRAIHLPKKAGLLQEAADWLQEMPDQSRAVMGEARGLITCARDLVKGKGRRARCDLDEGTADVEIATGDGTPVDGAPASTRPGGPPQPLLGSVTHTNLVAAGHSSLVLDLNGVVAAPGVLDGIGVGYRYAVSDALYVRLALGLDNFGSETDRDNQDDSAEESGIFTVAGGPEFILRRNENLSLYVGGLAQLSLSGEEQEETDTESDGTGFTLAAVLGVHWFPTRRLSLSAEYRFGLVHTQVTQDGGFEVETTSLQVGTGSTAFMLGFWF